MSIKDLEFEYSLTDDTWEDNLSWMFAVADALWHTDSSLIPAEWEFRHAPSGCDWSEDSLDFPDSVVHDAGATGEELLAFGQMLNAKDKAFRWAGVNY